MTDSELLLSALNTIEDFVLLLADDLSIRWANKAYRNAFSLDKQSGLQWIKSFSSESEQRILVLKDQLSPGTSQVLDLEQNINSDAKIIQYNIVRGGGRIAFIATGREVSNATPAKPSIPSRSREPVKLETDPRFGLATGAAFLQYVEKVFAKRGNGVPEFSCYLSSLDQYDDLVSRYGKEKADLTLIAVGQWLKTTMRGNDVVARYKNKGFAIFAYNAPAAFSMVVADRVRRAVSHPANPLAVTLSLSVGVASTDGGVFQSSSELLAGCSQALLEAQKRGGNTAVVHSAPSKEEEVLSSALDTLFEDF